MGGKGGSIQGPWTQPYEGFAGDLMGQLGGFLGLENVNPETIHVPGFGRVPNPNYEEGRVDAAGFQRQIQEAFAPHSLESLAGEQMAGFNPQSYFQGSQGLLESGANLATQADPYGGSDVLRQTLSPGFLDVQNDPAIQARNAALTQQAVSAIQQALPQVQSGAQRATGGVGVGSALGQQQGRLASNVLGGLTQQLAVQGAQDLARREAAQQGAMGTALGLPLQQAGLLSNLGGIQADIGGQQANLALQNLAGMAGLGGNLAQRNVGRFMAPYEMALNFLGLAQGTPVQGGGGFGSFLGSLGGLAGGIGTAVHGG